MKKLILLALISLPGTAVAQYITNGVLYATATGGNLSNTVSTSAPTAGQLLVGTGSAPTWVSALPSLSVNGNFGLGGPAATNVAEYFQGTESGPGAMGINNLTGISYTGGSTSAWLQNSTGGTLATGAFTSLQFINLQLGTPAVSGSANGTAFQLFISQAPAFTSHYGIYQAGTDLNYFNGPMEFIGTVGVGTAPTANVGLNLYETFSGNNNLGTLNISSFTYTGNNFSNVGFRSQAGVLTTGSFTNLTYYNAHLATPGLVSGNKNGTSAQLYIDQGAGFTNSYGIFQAGTDPNYLAGALDVIGNVCIGSSAVPNIGLYLVDSFSGNNNLGTLNIPSFTYNGNNFSNVGFRSQAGVLTTGSFTNLTYYNAHLATPASITGSKLGMSAQLYIDQGAGFTNSYGIYQAGTDSNYLNGPLLVNGNVGIGTLNPIYPLAVHGTIEAMEVLVQTGWSDYVFGKDYRLPPLSEVESYVKAEHHLPGIPSAKQVAENGVSLGEMQSKLLAQIEQLTLHQIEQEKRMAEQETRLNKQAGELDELRQENATLRLAR